MINETPNKSSDASNELHLERVTLSPAKAGARLKGDLIPGLRSLRFAHPGLLSVVAARLVDADIRVDSMLR